MSALSAPKIKPEIQTLLKSCRNMIELKQIHAQIIKEEENLSPFEASFRISRLLSFCASSPGGSIAYAKTIFRQQPNPSVPLHNCLLRGLSCSNNPLEALDLYRKMLQSGLRPNNFTYPFLMKACTAASATYYGVLIHTHVLKTGLELDIYVQSSLIHLYANGRDLLSAERLFDANASWDLVSCNVMIDAYVKSGNMGHAQSVFDSMGSRDVISWNAMINGHGTLGKIEMAKRLFDEMPGRNIISWNSMLAAYVKCGNVQDALELFEKMPHRDAVSWSTMLTCFAQNGKSSEALDLFDAMRAAGIRPNESTIVSLLSASAHLGILAQGLRIHEYANEYNVEVNSIVGTALVDMYCKCGSISRAVEVFNSMKYKDILAWNTILLGLATHGLSKEADRLFHEMQEKGTPPNDLTFVAMLGAFSHAGMIEEGLSLLCSMRSTFGIDPKVEHYGCVLDLLARTGRLEQAVELIETMPMEPNATSWGALLAGCRIYGNVEVGEKVGKHLINIQPHHSGRYILLSNLYAAAKHWDDARKVRNLMKAKGIAKVPGVSVIELTGIVHRFVAGDRSHPESAHIYQKWLEISNHLKSVIGYSPDTEQVLLDVEDEEKEHALSVHSEKLAIAYGLLHIAPEDVIRIVKNLRVCRDCHYVFKLISKFYVREIIMRDRNRFHHFKAGACSCMDFW